MVRYPSFVTKVNCDKRKLGNGIFIRSYLDVRFSIGNNRKSTVITYIMMNPSKADNDISDLSVNAVIKLSYNLACKQGIGNVKVNIVNLFPFYETNSKKLYEKLERYAEKEYIINVIIEERINESDTIIFAWGNIPPKCKELHQNKVQFFFNKINRKDNTFVLRTHYDNVLSQKANPMHPNRKRLIGLAGCYIDPQNVITLTGNEIQIEYKNAIVIHVPHSSTNLPIDIRQIILLNNDELNKELLLMTDWYVEELFCSDRVALVKNEYSRLVFDPERFRNDEDESMSKVGMGAIYTKTSSGNVLREIDPNLNEELLKKYYDPYHSRFNDVVCCINNIFGKCLIIDAHSFPSKALPYEKSSGKKRPDICIGTCDFHTPKKLSQFASDYFTSKKMTVALDYPYSGSITPMKFYKKTKKISTVMIEINRSLYMDEKTGKKNSNFNNIRDIISEFLQRLEEIYMS